jgi:hypothetical protein
MTLYGARHTGEEDGHDLLFREKKDSTGVGGGPEANDALSCDFKKKKGGGRGPAC